MADYKKMYLLLVDEIANSIDNLKSALEKAENIYIDTDEAIDEEGAANIILIKRPPNSRWPHLS